MSASPDPPANDRDDLTPPAARHEAAGRHGQHSGRGIAGSIWMLEHAQDVVTVLVGAVLIVLAGALLVSGIAAFAHGLSTAAGVPASITDALDRVLLVLILVEIVHTVVLSLRTHRLVAQPFIVVGLVAVIRRILFLLSSTKPIGTAELALLIAMVVVFVAGLIAVNKFGEQGRSEDI